MRDILGEISLCGATAEANQRMRDDRPSVGKRRQAQDARIRRMKWMKCTRNSKISMQINIVHLSCVCASNLHEDRDHPPDIPAFSGSTPKRSRQQESFSDAIGGAAVAIVKALSAEAPSKVNDIPLLLQDSCLLQLVYRLQNLWN